MNAMNQLNRLVLTGATSSIGIFVVQECMKHGIKVDAIYRFTSPKAGYIPDHPLVKKIDCDLEGLKNLDMDGEHCDVFLHLACSNNIGNDRNNLIPHIKNIEYTIDAVNLAERLGCHTFMGAGSQAEYGEKQVDLTECTPTTPTTAYGIAKLCAGQMSRLSCKEKGIRHLWPRIVSSYGPCCPEQTVLIYSIRELLHGHSPKLTDGNQIWDFLYLEDTARALLAILEKGRDGEVYLVSSGLARPLKEYLLETRDYINPNLEISFGAVAHASSTVQHLSADISKLRNETGWKPIVSFEEGIKRTIEWVKCIEGIKV